MTDIHGEYGERKNVTIFSTRYYDANKASKECRVPLPIVKQLLENDALQLGQENSNNKGKIVCHTYKFLEDKKEVEGLGLRLR